MITRARIATTGQGGLMTDQIAERDGSPAHVSTGQLPTPDEARRLIEAAYERYRGVRDGTVATYIPALASVSPDLFGLSVVAANGNVHSVGDALCPFTIQSISKAFVLRSCSRRSVPTRPA